MTTIKIVRSTDDPNLMGTVIVQNADKATSIGFSKDSGIPQGKYDLVYRYDPLMKRRLWNLKGTDSAFFPKVEYNEAIDGIVLFAHPYVKGEDGKLIVAKCKGDVLVQLNAELRKDTTAKLVISDIDVPGETSQPPVVKHKKKHRDEEHPPATGVLDDDLTLIKGLGKASAKLLEKSAVTTFKALAELDAEELKELMVGHSKRMASVDTSTWAEEAKALYLSKDQTINAGKNARKDKK